jgi:hypothetical protein
MAHEFSECAKPVREQQRCPQRLKPGVKRCSDRSGEPLHTQNHGDAEYFRSVLGQRVLDHHVQSHHENGGGRDHQECFL